MSDPLDWCDEWERPAMEMLADLDEIPESIRLANEAAIRSIAAGALRPGAFHEAMIRSLRPRLVSGRDLGDETDEHILESPFRSSC